MSILVTGATGFVGRNVCLALVGSGKTVTACSRNPVAAQRVLPEGIAVVAWDPLAEPLPSDSLKELDAVVHLAGESVVGRWTTAKKRAIRDSRVHGTRNLVQGLLRLETRPKVLVSASAVGFYGDRGDELLDEDSVGGDDFLAEVSRAWEAEALRAQEKDVRVVLLRIGVVLGVEGGALEAMLPPFKAGLGGAIGSGRQWWSWIHLEDLVGMILFALEDPGLQGVFNATSPEAVRQKQFARELAGILKRPAWVPLPGFAAKVALGGFASELLSSKKVYPRRMVEAGFSFRHPKLRDALQDLLG